MISGAVRGGPLLAGALVAVLAAGCAGADPPAAAPSSVTGAPTPVPTTPSTPARTTPTGAGPVTVHATQVPALHASVDGYPEATVLLRPAGESGTHRVAVKVADTPDRRRHGLMEVPELPAGTGMLFVFSEDRTGGFWMKDTLVPLSIAFVDASGTVVDVLEMQPCPTPPPTGGCPVYTPGAAYRTALEVPRGFLTGIGIGEGASVSIRR